MMLTIPGKQFNLSLSMHSAFRTACLLTVFFILAGCSNIKPFPSTADKNLQVRTKVTGTFFREVKAVLQIHSMKGGCVVDYLGTVDLKDGLTQVGVVPGQPVYLIFLFNISSFAGGGTMMPYTTVFTPRSGTRYIADVSYADSIYYVSIHEVGSRGVLGRELERKAVACPKTD